MVVKELFINDLGIKLVRTYSTDGYKLLQKETSILYSDSVIDIIEGYDNNIPYSRFTYEETNEQAIKEEALL